MIEKHKLVFASNNANKVAEIAAALPDSYEVLSLKDIGCDKDIPETGEKLEDNAIIKANYVRDNFSLDVFADDTGLEVYALNGEPGVHSARYAGEHRDNEANINKVLQLLSEVEDRSARFRTVICLIHQGKHELFEGMVNGHIRRERSGTGGFGYDSIFQPEGYDITFAEMSMEDKNQVSHRGKAFRKLIDYMSQK